MKGIEARIEHCLAQSKIFPGVAARRADGGNQLPEPLDASARSSFIPALQIPG
jgi:hypothetical protein